MEERDGRVAELRDEAAILPVLLQDRRWAAYAIGDLEPEHRPHARFVGRLHAGTADALVLIYAPPAFTSLVPCGDEEGIWAILAEAADLPAEALFLIRRRDLAALEARYHVEQRWTMLRMAVEPRALRETRAVEAEVRWLSDADLPALETLYAIWPDSVFNRTMFVSGMYYGAFRDGELVAAAGTHAISIRHGIAVIGNVYTHPAHRGAGLATAVTGAVTRALGVSGVRDVVLNVREDNRAAISTYARLGFVLHEPFWEGRARWRG
jgi:ribosomal protein S18 acetylase RimI-like enzyme